MMDWNDYPIVLAIARHRSLYRAARDLDVAVSTVMRRLAQIETRAGLALFHKTQDGHEPTAAGDIIIAKAEEMEALSRSVELSLQAERSAQERTLRISASQVIAPFFVAKHLSALKRACPEHEIILTITDKSPSQGIEGFDVSLWPSSPSNEDLFGRKLTNVKWATFGASDATAITPDRDEIIEIIGLDNSAQYRPLSGEDIPPTTATNSLIAAAAMASATEGLAFLPCILGRSFLRLKQLTPAQDHHIGQLWAIYRKDTTQLPQVRAALGALVKAAVQDKNLFLGL